jgi:hypothetical protein
MKASIRAISLSEGYEFPEFALQKLESSPDMVEKKCIISFNNFYSDIIAEDEIGMEYQRTNEMYFIGITDHSKFYVYDPDTDEITQVDKKPIIDRVVEEAKF